MKILLFAIIAIQLGTYYLLNQKLKSIMSKQEDFDAALDKLDAATTEIANDLTALRDEVKGTISTESLARLDANILALEVMGQDPIPPDV